MDGMPAVDNWRRLATAVIPMQVVGRDGHLGGATHRASYTLTTFISLDRVCGHGGDGPGVVLL
jgi:hypothetical protein